MPLIKNINSPNLSENQLYIFFCTLNSISKACIFFFKDKDQEVDVGGEEGGDEKVEDGAARESEEGSKVMSVITGIGNKPLEPATRNNKK